MKSVNIAELKNRLSVYLNDVKAGEEILVRDRNQPVARIVPLARSMDEDEELLALPRYRHSDLFTEREKLALDYTVAVMRTPVEVTDSPGPH